MVEILNSRPKRLPLEIIMGIVTFALDFDLSWDSNLSKPDWTIIEGMSLACKKYRSVVLEAWFRIFKPKCLTDWKSMKLVWSEIYRWTRAINCPHDCIDFEAEDLLLFKKLKHIRIDFAGPQAPSDFTTDVDKAIDYIPATVRHLEIRGLTWPEPMVMQRIARAVPELRTLSLQQPMIWCGLCNTCSISELTAPFPETLTYEKGIGLPHHYAKFLAPLRHLHTVRLTVAVGEGQFATLDKDNTYLWAGECEMCMERLYGDDAFRTEWIERKRRAEPRPPALKRVEWVLLECTKKYWSDFMDAWPGLLE